MIREPVKMRRWYTRANGSFRFPIRLNVREGWSTVEFYQIMRNVPNGPRMQRSTCSALKWWTWASKAAIEVPGWWPEGVPEPEDFAIYTGVAE